MSENAFINARPLLKIDGEENPELMQALHSMVINLPLSGTAHGELTFSNWIPGGEAAELDFGFQNLGFGKRIEIMMGENQDQLIFSGDITALEERYGDSAPQLILLIQDRMHILARQRFSRLFEDQSPDDICSSVASELGLGADVNISQATASYHQMNESNLAFLMRLASSHGVALRIVDGSLRARPEEPDAEPLEVNPRDNALKVRLLADLNHQPAKISVQGFNSATNEVVLGEADSVEGAGDGISARQLAGDLGWPGDDYIPQPAPRNQSEAEQYARAHFARQARNFISGDIHCIGEPTLRSGREVNLTEVSSRLAGKYQVVHCCHHFNSERGFETHIKVSRATGQS